MNTLKKLRLRGAIPTQKEAAEGLGIKASVVSKWERGITRPRIEKLPKIAQIYGCTIEEILAEEGEKSANSDNDSKDDS